MNFELLANELHIAENILALMLGVPRLFMIIQTAPFLGSAVITGSVRVSVAIAIYAILHPVILNDLIHSPVTGFLEGTLSYGLIIIKETLLGTLFGLLIGMLFWAVQGVGIFIDNQRGANQAQETDILSGDQISPFGALFFQCLVMVFFITGGFMLVLQTIYNSYIYWPVTSFLPVKMLFSPEFPLFFAGLAANVMLMIAIYSGPIMLACFLADLSLGLINRFASQLNVYVLAMPIKSAIASFLAIFYLAVFMKFITPMFQEIINTLQELSRFV